ncbi:MAG: NUDIX hydrolase [Thermoguttaceae bacterium]
MTQRRAVSNEPSPRLLAEGKFVRVLSHRGWEWVERTTCSAAVVIVAVTDQRQLLLVEQYRIPLGKRVIELPAGLVGDLADTKGEALAEAARRELIEETGYQAETFERLLEGPSSSGLSNEVFTMMLAQNVRCVGPGGGDATEEIEVHAVPLDMLHNWLGAKRRDGLLISPKIFAALYFLHRNGLGTKGV